MELDLIELSENLSFADIAELIARVSLRDAQMFANNALETLSDPDDIAQCNMILGDVDSMINEARNMYSTIVGDETFVLAVLSTIESAAEEYVR